MDVVAAFVADAETPILVQPGDRPLDDPALLAEPGAAPAFRPGDFRLDAAAAQLFRPSAAGARQAPSGETMPSVACDVSMTAPWKVGRPPRLHGAAAGEQGLG